MTSKKKSAPQKSAKNEASGDRLKECMKMNNTSNVELQSLLDKKGIDMDITYISQMRNGWRPISYENAQMFAELLNINPDYLLGSDHFIADSYEEFLELTESNTHVSKVALQLPKLERYLKPNGYSILGFNCEDDDESIIENYTFHIRHGKKIINLSYNELIQFNADVDEYATLSAQRLFKMHQFDSDSIEL